MIRLLFLIIFFISKNLFANEVNIFSSRHYESDIKLYNKFTNQTGIKVNVVSGNAKALEKRIIEEGEECVADIFIAADAGRLGSAEKKGIFKKVYSEILNEKIPPNFRSEKWYGIAKRARILFYNPELVKESDLEKLSYLDLSDSRWKNKLVIRQSSSIYNQSLVAYMIENYGQEKTKEWVEGIVKNMAREPQGNDRSQILAVAAKEAEIAVANTYYYGLMMSGKKGKEQMEAAKRVKPFFPNQFENGTHINVSGVGILKYSKNEKNSLKLIEFLLTDEAQKHMVENTFEYPMSENVEPNKIIKKMGLNFKQDLKTNLSSYSRFHQIAYKIMLEAGWN